MTESKSVPNPDGNLPRGDLTPADVELVGVPAAEVVDEQSEPATGAEVPSERVQSTTVGTGSYVAISCTVMALMLTFAILGLLFLFRWLG